MLIDNFYKISPVFAQNWMISLYGFYWRKRRYGGVFQKEVVNFKKRESYTKEEWKKYQTNELRKLLVHAYETVPFYTSSYKNAGFTKNNFLNFQLQDIKELPFLEKEDLRKYGTSTLLSKKKKKGQFYSSSGSTGTPVKVFLSREFHQKWSAAYEARIRNWAGIDYKTPRGMIGGRRILPNTSNKPPFYRYNFFEKQTYFSAYHISENTAGEYLRGIVKNKVEYMVGYAMSNYFLADFIKKQNFTAPKLKAVITSSEKLTNQMRETFKSVYNCKTYDSYSGVEACGLISENNQGDFLFSPDTGIMELLNPEGKEVANGEEGELVLTGLLNYDQPLIRYRIGDRAIKSENQKAKSGIEMPVIKEILGREEDIIVSEDGKKMVRFHSVFTNIDGLKLSQLIQETNQIITINLVVDDKLYHKQSEEKMERVIKSQLGENIFIEFNYVQDIPKTENGKYKSVISKM